jgi:hypothetical protein
MNPNHNSAKDLALLAFPLWGTVAASALLSVTPKFLEPFWWLLYLPWCLGLLLSPTPILRSERLGVSWKALALLS